MWIRCDDVVLYQVPTSELSLIVEFKDRPGIRTVSVCFPNGRCKDLGADGDRANAIAVLDAIQEAIERGDSLVDIRQCASGGDK